LGQIEDTIPREPLAQTIDKHVFGIGLKPPSKRVTKKHDSWLFFIMFAVFDVPESLAVMLDYGLVDGCRL
jgi:hypothetical protein